MIVYTITIEATPLGVATNAILVKDSTDPAERKIASILDCGVRATFEFLAKEESDACKNTVGMIEGHNIEEFVHKQLKSLHAGDLKEALKKAGYECPG